MKQAGIVHESFIECSQSRNHGAEHRAIMTVEQRKKLKKLTERATVRIKKQQKLPTPRLY